MPFSSGTYSLPGPALNPGDTVSSVENNQFRNDVATAFNETFLRDGTAEATANLPMDGFKLTGLAAGTTAGDSARYDELAALDAAAVKLTGNQTIAGTKTFSSPIAADITGNAATATNATTVTNGVYTTGDQTISGVKTFSSAIAANITGNAATVTNGVYTTGDQTIAGVKTFSSQPVLPQKLTSGTAQNTTSGTSIDFTSIPSWVKRITVMVNGLSSNGTSNLLIQLGTTSSIESTGYASSTSGGGTNVFSTAGYILTGSVSAASALQGSIQLANLNGNEWVASGALSYATTTTPSVICGGKTLGGLLTRIRLTTVGGTDTFDAGSINILYE